MNTIYGFNIDALRLCFVANEPRLLDELSALHLGEIADFYDFHLLRSVGKHFDHVFQIRYQLQGEDVFFGELCFGLHTNDPENQTRSNARHKVWIRLQNKTLYSEFNFHCLSYICSQMNLEFHNFTTLDLCLDMRINIAKKLRSLIHNKELDVVLNGRRIRDRKADRPEIIYTSTGDLNRDKYLTLNIKQKKAIKDKSKGTTLIAYNKAAEISNSSSKHYIHEIYGNPKHLYRLEVHLNNDDIKEFCVNAGVDFNLGLVYDQHLLIQLYIKTINNLIRFAYNNKPIEWRDILTGVITIPPAKQPPKLTKT